jgi:sterol desaturase/sphingolipid hydroxylase (fatty acid hydroxylase superfamily)
MAANTNGHRHLDTFLQTHEAAIRLGFFFGIFAVMALWEFFAPRRALTVGKAVRWVNNLGLVALNTLLLRLLFPAAAVGMAAFANDQGWGLIHHFQVAAWLAVPIAIIALDFLIWLQHVMVHAIPVLWRLHRVHHADVDFDVTTGSRFHPLEILLSMLIKFATIALLGPPVVAVIIFEVLLSATAMFNHGNVRLPAKLDGILRWFVVTPDMHRVHHSTEDDETNSNFGFNLPWWDRLFGTYRDQPRGGHEDMTIGIRGYEQPRDVSWLPGMIMLPFRGKVAGYVINRRRWTNQRALKEEDTASQPRVRPTARLPSQ